MHVGCKCNVVIATCPQCYLESTFLRCHNVLITTLSQPKDNVVTTLSQRDFVCWDCSSFDIRSLPEIQKNENYYNLQSVYSYYVTCTL